MSAKIAADHLARGAVVYVRQSTMTQVPATSRAKSASTRSRTPPAPPASRRSR